MRKASYIVLAAILAVMISVPAMAFQVTTRSAEMVAHSPCDQAGSITMKFEEADVTLLNSYLLTNDYAEIRVFLGAEEWPGGTPMPNLCKDIQGSAVATSVPHSGELVLLDDTAEMSSFGGGVDAEVYVWGEDGNDVIYVYITSVIDSSLVDWSDEGVWPWFKFGLHDTLDNVDVSTAICAQVLNFENPTTLTISNEAIPNTLTFTGDNEIGHFRSGPDFTVTDCVKNEFDGYTGNTTEIELCELGSSGQVAECPKYQYCFIIEGDFGADRTIDVTMRTNGADCNDDTQQGVYFEDIDYYINGNPVITTTSYFEDDCTTSAARNCAWKAEYAEATIADGISDSDELMIVVTYSVNPDEAVEGTKVRFWYDIMGMPCSALTSGERDAADLVPCGGGTIYFPYVISGGNWATGVVVTNLNSPLTASDIAAMEATFTLTDYTGASFTYTKTDFTTGIWVATVDNLIAEAGWSPAVGAAWLKVSANFDLDGYSFLTDGTFGAGTLARIPQ